MSIVPAARPDVGQEKVASGNFIDFKRKCSQCGHKWSSKIEHPKWCPKCHLTIWEQPRSARTYSKFYGQGDKRNFVAEPGKRMSHKLDALQSRLSFYRLCKERDFARIALGQILELDDGEEAHRRLAELKKLLDWNACNYQPDLQKWDNAIAEEEQEFARARNAYRSYLENQPPRMLKQKKH